MNLGRLGSSAAIGTVVFVGWLGGCGSNGATPCGVQGVKNGTCQTGPTCPSGSAEISIVDPFDQCSQLVAKDSLCCVPSDAATVIPTDTGNNTPDTGATPMPDATVGHDAGTDATSMPDSGTPDSTTSPDVTTTPDTGTDAGVDAGTDAGTDTGTDAGTDAGTDTGVDAGQDATGGLLANGSACTGSGATCLSGNCVSGVCCNVACTGTCQACSAALTGGTDGTCADETAGKAAPTGQCAAAPPCGNDGKCAVGGVCELATAATSCGAPSCTAGALTGAGTCDGLGTCGVGTTAPCTGGFICADATSCKTSCTANTDCESALDGCVGGACVTATCTDGVQDQNETSVDCGGVCGTCTVLVLGAGASSTVGGEYHPDSGWVASTTLGGESVSSVSLTFLPGGTSAVGLMRFTELGNGNDQSLQSTTWAPGAWTAFANVGAGITTANGPTLGSNGAGALGAFRGTDDNYYYATYTAGVWSGALAVEPLLGTQSSGPDSPAFDGTSGTLVFGGDNQNTYTQAWSGLAWSAAADLDTANLTSLSPTITGLKPLGSAALLSYVRASDGQVFYSVLSGGAWSTPAAITGANTGDPVALAYSSAGATLAFRGMDGSLYYALYTGGAWGTVLPFATPNLSVTGSPALAHGVGAATAELAFVEGDDIAYHARLIGGAWTSPVAIGGANLDNLTIVSSP